MTSKVFVDSNIVVYSLDGKEPVKRDRARDLLRSLKETGRGVVSTQVLQETYWTSTRKLKMEPLEAKAAIRQLDTFEIVTVTPAMVFEAIDCSILNTLSLWDSLILAAAASAQCDTLWSEDMNDGQVVLGVRIVNPLADIGEASGGSD